GREDAGIERATGDDRNAALGATRKQRRQRGLIGERVAAGKQNDVHVCTRQRVETYLNVVHAEAIGGERPFRLSPRERWQRAVDHLSKLRRLLVAVRRDIDVV